MESCRGWEWSPAEGGNGVLQRVGMESCRGWELSPHQQRVEMESCRGWEWSPAENGNGVLQRVRVDSCRGWEWSPAEVGNGVLQRLGMESCRGWEWSPLQQRLASRHSAYLLIHPKSINYSNNLISQQSSIFSNVYTILFLSVRTFQLSNLDISLQYNPNGGAECLYYGMFSIC